MKYFLVLVVAFGLCSCALPTMSREEAIEFCTKRANQRVSQPDGGGWWNYWFVSCMDMVGHGEALSNRLNHCGVSGLKCR